jgi:type II secretory pathway pseudopilin PulG
MTLITGRRVERGGSAGDPAGATGSYAGFTMLELVLVMLLVSLLMGLAAPCLRGFVLGRKSSDAVAQVLTLAQYAHDQAASSGANYRLNVDTATGSYWLTMQKGGEFRELGTEFGRRFSLPERVQAAWLPYCGPRYQPTSQLGLTKQAESQLHNYIEFFPDGRTEAANLRLMDRDGQVTELGCLSETEPLTVLQKGGR